MLKQLKDGDSLAGESTSNRQKSFVLLLTYILIIGLFVVDLKLPLGYAGGMPYLLPVVIAGLWAGNTTVVVTAVLCSGLTMLGFFLSFSAGVQSWIVIINRVGATIGIWAAVAGVAIYKHREHLVRQARQQSGHAQEAHRESEARYSALIESAVDGFVTADEDGIIESINPSAEVMFGYGAEEVIGKNISALISSPEVQRLQEFLNTEGEVAGRTKDGMALSLHISVSEMRFGGHPVFSGILRDITEEKEIAQQLRQSQKMEVVGSLASGVAHDVNNLLMGVSGCTEVALGKLSPDHPARLYLSEIKNSVTSGAAITRQLLAFARQSKDEGGSVVLDEAVRRAEGMLRRLLGENVELDTSLDASNLHIACDEGEFEQILLNLVVNARDALSAACGTITVSTSRGLDNSRVTLEVRDTGSGIDPKTQKEIFKPFFTTKESGTGLGLATVQRIVKKIGGRVSLESTLGQGSMFCVQFPLASGEPIPTDLESSFGRAGDDETVLLLEDEPLVRMTVRHYLERWGYQVIEAGSGAEAIRKCRLHDGSLELLLSDVVLPGAWGPQVADQIQKLRPGIPVIYMSAHGKVSHVEAGRLPADAELLEKPFTEKQLLSRLRNVLGESKATPPPPAEPLTAPPLLQIARDPNTRETRILFVEDLKAARMACQELLEDLGHSVIASATGAEAIEACRDRKRPIDLIMTDFGLPDMTGKELVDELRKLDVLCDVIYVSGRSKDDPELREALRDPQTSFIQKPVDFDEMESRVETLLQSQAHHSNRSA